jgi:hypothetical protein
MEALNGQPIFSLQIIKIPANHFDFGSISLRIAITDKLLIPAMQGFNVFGVFNWAPELFCTSGDFLYVSD